ncbi:hypothetical protein C2845_PM07G12190 [Panicum miliaceum]|uniref:Uncharacterized protein n=1 Tax=Panicum miliaceum TaxID=4540 RepID=A0A3L6SP40_PANMI|nr:hypothetical protein C2845_PM07G12190 [Panicum miliaceum]
MGGDDDPVAQPPGLRFHSPIDLPFCDRSRGAIPNTKATGNGTSRRRVVPGTIVGTAGTISITLEGCDRLSVLIAGSRRICDNLREVADAFALSGSHPISRTSFVLEASQALLSAVVLRAHPLSSERLNTALRVAERDLARAVEGGDAAAVADLRLLLAFLAARVGRFDEALARYEEVARDDPSDPRPHFLAVLICVHVSRPKEESDKWRASNKRLGLAKGSSFRDSFALMTLTEELLVALALASPTAFDVRNPVRMRSIVGAAGSTVDAALVSELRSKNMSIVERMEVRAVRALLYAGMWSALKE